MTPIPLLNMYTAMNPSTDHGTLTVLSKRLDGILRAAVAGNPNATPEILASLASDDESRVLYEVAANRNTPYGIWLQDGYGRVLP